MLRTAFSRIVATFRQRRLEEDFDEELQDHLHELTDRYVRRGMTPEEARYAARRQFGRVIQVKQDQRDRRVLPADLLMQDVRHAFRQLRNAKGSPSQPR